MSRASASAPSLATCALAVLVWSLPSAATAAALRGVDDLAPTERTALECGEPIMASLESDGGEGAQALFMIDAPVDRAWALLTDYPSFDKWMTGMKEVTMVTWPSADVALLGVVIPSPIRDVHYVMRRVHEPQRKVAWTRHSGDLKSVVGAYEFFPYGTDRTVVRYHAVVDIGVWVPAFVKRHFTTQGLKGLVSSIQAEAQRRYPRTPAAPAAQP